MGGVSPAFISQAKLWFEHALSQEDQTVCLENDSLRSSLSKISSCFLKLKASFDRLSCFIAIDARENKRNFKTWEHKHH